MVPLDDLTPEAVTLISVLGSSATKVSQIIDNQDRAVFTAIQDGIDKANEEAIVRPQKVGPFCYCSGLVHTYIHIHTHMHTQLRVGCDHSYLLLQMGLSYCDLMVKVRVYSILLAIVILAIVTY